MEQDESGIAALVEALIEREGDYSHHPADRGGPTRFGITEAVARAHGYCGAMRELPRDEAAAIYRRLYWLRPKFDQVARRSAMVAAELFDTGVNMGPAVAATFLQRALTALNRNGRDFTDLGSRWARRPQYAYRARRLLRSTWQARRRNRVAARIGSAAGRALPPPGRASTGQ